MARDEQVRRPWPVWVRIALIYLAVVNGIIGIWASLAPRGFYDDFPGGGRVWVAVDGPFNQHLVRDVGAWALGLTVVFVAAAWLMSRHLVTAAGAAALVSSLPHAIYHSRHADVIGAAGDKLTSIGGLYLGAAVGLAVLLAGVRAGRHRRAAPAAAR